MWVRPPPALPYIRELPPRTPPYMAVKEHAKCRLSSLSGAFLVHIYQKFQIEQTQLTSYPQLKTTRHLAQSCLSNDSFETNDP